MPPPGASTSTTTSVLRVTHQTNAAAHADGCAARKPARRLVQQHDAARVDAGPAAAHELAEIGKLPVRQQHHPRQRPRILVDIGIPGTGDEIQIPGLERGVDLLNRHSAGDEAHAEQIGEGRAVGGTERREATLRSQGNGVADPRRLLEPAQPQRIVAEHVVEIVREREIRPVIVDADQLDAIAPVGRRGGGEPRLEQAHGLIAGVLAQRLETLGRQCRRDVRSVVPGEIAGHEGRDQGGGRRRRAKVQTSGQHQHRDRRHRECDRSGYRNEHRSNAHDRSGQRQRRGDEPERNERSRTRVADASRAARCRSASDARGSPRARR